MLHDRTTGRRSPRFTRALGIRLLIAAVIVFLAVAVLAYTTFFRREAPPSFEADEEHFLYGSIGTEAQGVPYWIWLVLPRIFPDLLPGPGGYAALGVIGTDGHEMPVGFSKVTIGYPRVGINCAACHAASVRLRPGEPPVVVAGAPGHQTDLQGYYRFLAAAAADPRFSATRILGEISKNVALSATERLLYRVVIIPQTRRALARLADDNAWMQNRPAWGRGRTDVANVIKTRVLAQPADDTVGSADAMGIWATTEGAAFQWDGSSTNLRETIVAHALASGVPADWIDDDLARWDEADGSNVSSLRRVMDFAAAQKPPAFPFAVDQGLANAGELVFQTECGACHAPDGARYRGVVPAGEVGTDPRRQAAWAPASVEALHAFADGRDWDFSSSRSTDGYVAPSLQGIWVRGPYLHNGSVPTLADLLEPPERRPARFWRGYDVLDPVKVGFISSGEEAERDGTMLDTTQPGNGNGGHLYGTTLSAEQKRALLEYLKTL